VVSVLDRNKENPYRKENPCTRSVVITSKLTSKAQTTVPQPVRLALGLNAGDEIGYVIEPGRVFITRASRDPVEDPFGTFEEWSSEADRRAYGGL
jgi:antitoxin PrlF